MVSAEVRRERAGGEKAKRKQKNRLAVAGGAALRAARVKRAEQKTGEA